jgi:hypothetical protein
VVAKCEAACCDHDVHLSVGVGRRGNGIVGHGIMWSMAIVCAIRHGSVHVKKETPGLTFSRLVYITLNWQPPKGTHCSLQRGRANLAAERCPSSTQVDADADK